MAFNCPHCAQIMYPDDDGKCPICKEQVREDVQSTSKYIYVKHEQWIPAVCCICGSSADKYFKVKLDRKINDKSFFFKVFSTIFLLLFSPIIVLFKSYEDKSLLQGRSPDALL